MDHLGHDSKLHDYLRVLRRRKWLVLQAVVLLPLAAVLLSLRQERLYEASAQVLLSRDDLTAALTGTITPSSAQQPERLAETQAELARVSAVARRVLAATGSTRMSVEKFLSGSSVTAKPEADLLTFRVRNPSPERAELLATSYARQFTAYRRRLDTAALVTARQGLRERIAALDQAGRRDSGLYSSLVEKEEQLRTMEALKTSNATLVQAGEKAVLVQPRPVRNGLLALALGLIVGLALAFLRDTLDTRVHEAEEVAEQLGMPLLARLPEPSRRLRGNDLLVMVESPAGRQAEAFRMLRTNLEFVNLRRQARTIMVTSASAREGKSTTVANLAVAIARAGRHVVAVDLDLRRPYLDRFFDVRDHPGLTQVVLGHVELASATVPIAITGAAQQSANGNGHGVANGNGSGHELGSVSGLLEVVPAGPLPPDPGELVGLPELREVLQRLRARADVVLVDSPPILQVGDALTLSTAVDGIVVVAGRDRIRRPVLAELRRALEQSPAAKLGFVLTGAGLGESYGYGDYYETGGPVVREGRATIAS
jgi:tyrosine-protein kinase